MEKSGTSVQIWDVAAAWELDRGTGYANDMIVTMSVLALSIGHGAARQTIACLAKLQYDGIEYGLAD
jgi:hypothetical protein